MEHALGADLSRVRIREGVHIGARGALAMTEGTTVSFAPRQFLPATRAGQRLLAHELTHVVQRERGRLTGQTASTQALEHEARDVASAVGNGSQVTITGRAAARPYYSLLSESVEAAATKGEAFDILRAAGPAPGDTDLSTVIQARFGDQPDDFWLAKTLQANGPETLWPIDLINERVRRAHAGVGWKPEAGNIAATLPDPDPDPGQSLPPTIAYFFPGQTEHRALIIGGVHGGEPEGVEVVERLRALLATQSKAGHPPYFTTILVPNLIPRTYSGPTPPTDRESHQQVPGGVSLVKGKQKTRKVEPNRNFPQPGTSYAAARKLGATRSDTAELLYENPHTHSVAPPQKDSSTRHTSIRMLPETRILIKLLERFQPERLASVHAHSLSEDAAQGNAPGIFVDPRGVNADTGKPTDPTNPALASQTAADDDLARRLVVAGRSQFGGARTGKADPFWGNRGSSGPTEVRYALGATHAEGNSLGMYAPIPVPGVRPGITTVTVEVPEWAGTKDATDLPRIEDLDSKLLDEIFLGDPAVVSTKFPTK
jgi:hypothetical protein